MAQNLTEKIVQRFAVGLQAGEEIHSGSFVSIRPAHVMSHDNTGAIIPKFQGIGARRVADPRQVVVALDHNIQDVSEANQEKYARIRSFAREMGLDFYGAGRGIGHQIMCEEGYAWPGSLVVASDSHSNMYGGLGCLGTPVVRTDAAAIWATGRTWWQVPPVARVELTGSLPKGVSGKDVILALCGIFNKDEVLNHSIEFVGDGVAALSISDRLSIANMTTEWGALSGVFPIDARTIAWLRARIDWASRRGLAGVPSDEDGAGHHPRLNAERLDHLERTLPAADPDAWYQREIVLNLSSIRPLVTGPNTVKVTQRASRLKEQNIQVQKAYLVSCVNSRSEDIAQAAAVVAGHRVAPGVEFYIAAASSEVEQECILNGTWQTLLDAGAIALPLGCGPCIGLGRGLLEPGETGISATNRNFKGRMGSPEAFAWLASPAVVAASAIAGVISDPTGLADCEPESELRIRESRDAFKGTVTLLPGFPASLEGELIFCDQDNLNTDGIYPGKYTYQDDITLEGQARVLMENHDPEFRQIARRGDLLLGGMNFGTGSSREQAATAFKAFGISVVLAGSFSETYKRNAINNGFLVLEAPALLAWIRQQALPAALTVRTGMTLRIDFHHSRLHCGEMSWPLDPVGTAAQEMIVLGGLENWVRSKLQ